MTDRLRRVLESHFDPRHGTPYWLEREREVGIRARDEIRTMEDLSVFGPFPREALRTRPLEDFVPRWLWTGRSGLVLAETGGTTGRPVRTVFTPAEFEEAFGRPFLAASLERGFPRGGNWLFVGPSGPHAIGQAARLLARLHRSLEPFSVDLDPRWARAQEPGSLGASVYLSHVIDQALDVVARETIDVLFTTPPLALALAGAMPEPTRHAIRGVHLGGMVLGGAAYAAIRKAFPQAIVLPGYGNSLFGILVEAIPPGPDLHADYFPLPGRLVVRVVGEDGREVAPGEEGRVSITRLDESVLIVDHRERDVATRIDGGPPVAALGLVPSGVRDPRPLAPDEAHRGIY